MKRDGKMSNYKYNRGTRCLLSQNLDTVLGVIPFSMEVGVLRTQSVNNNKMLCAIRSL